MSDERFHPGWSEPRDDASSGRRFGRPGDSRLPDGCPLPDGYPEHERGPRQSPASLAESLRPYRIVQRYRGDRIGQSVVVGDWADLWPLRSGDISWPKDRLG